MSGGDDVVVNPESVEQTAQGVSTALGQAAEPGPVPHAAGASPIDAAASAASGEVIGLVSAASGDLAPRGGEVVGVTQDALAGLQTAEGQNTTDLQVVGDQAHAPMPVRPGAADSTASAAPGGPASALTGGLGQVEQVLSSGASTIGAPEGALGPLQQVASTGMSGSTAPANMSSGSHAGAEDWDNFSEGSFEPLPSGPPGAAADPNAGPGVPESLI